MLDRDESFWSKLDIGVEYAACESPQLDEPRSYQSTKSKPDITSNLEANPIDTSTISASGLGNGTGASQGDQFEVMQERKRKRCHGSIFTVSASLLAFMDLRGHQTKKQCSKLDVRRRSFGMSSSSVSSVNSQAGGSDSSTGEGSYMQESDAAARQDMLAFSCSDKLDVPCTIFLNNDLLQSRPKLVSWLVKKEESGLSIIYRDFESDCEAVPDMILNERSCLLITDNQSVIQRPLPGDNSYASLSPLKQRIQRLWSRFDSISVLVCEIAQSEIRSTISQDNSRHEFESFCESICPSSVSESAFQLSPPTQIPHDVGVHPIWIEHESINQRNRQLESTIWLLIQSEGRHFDQDTSLPSTQSVEAVAVSRLNHPPGVFTSVFTQVETAQELALRRAGFNCMAAQVITHWCVSHQKTENDANRVNAIGWSEDHPSLQKFVNMTAKDKKETFGYILGARIISNLDRMLQ